MKIRSATSQGISEIIKIGNSVNEFQVSGEVVTFWPKSILVDCINSKQNPILIAEEKNKLLVS